MTKLATIKYIVDQLQTIKFDEIMVKMKQELGISARVYDKYVLLDYSQIDSPKDNQIAQECRSLIITRSNDPDDIFVLSRKFSRFFNHGEMREFYKDFEINNDMVLMAKEDGSLIGVWYDPFDEIWQISTRGMAKAEGNHPMGGSFREAVLCAFDVTEADFQAKCNHNLSKSRTYIFEFVGKSNRIVRPYMTDEMVLLGVSINEDATNTTSSKDYINYYVDELIAVGMNVRAPVRYTVPATFEEIQKMADELPGLEEGFVLYDQKTDKRMKFKARKYVVAHSIRGDNTLPTPKNVYTLVLTNEQAEFLAYFPEYTDLFATAEQNVNAVIQQMGADWLTAAHLGDQKAFAQSIAKSQVKGFLFSARKNGTSPLTEWKAASVDQKLKFFL